MMPRGGRRGRGGGKPSPGRPRQDNGRDQNAHAFSLRDEVSNTERRSRVWNRDIGLRYQAVTFVSSGTPAKEVEYKEDELRPSDFKPSTEASHTLHEETSDTPSGFMARLNLQPNSKSGQSRLQHPLHVKAVTSGASMTRSGDLSENINPGAAPGPSLPLGPAEDGLLSNTAIPAEKPVPLIRAASPAQSDSSDDVVVFKGRAAPRSEARVAKPDPTPSAPVPSSTTSSRTSQLPKSTTSSSKRPMNGRLATEKTSSQASQARHTTAPNILDYLPDNVEPTGDWDDNSSTPWVHRSKLEVGWAGNYIALDERRKGKKSAKEVAKALRKEQEQREREAQDEAVRDYIENLRQNQADSDIDLNTDTITGRNLALDDGNDIVVNRRSPPVTEFFPPSKNTGGAWDEIMLRDFENISTSSDVAGDITQILGKRHRRSGLQYLVVYEDRIVDDARWLPISFLTRDSEHALIASFEQEQEARRKVQGAQDLDSDSGSGSSDAGAWEDANSADDSGGSEESDDLWKDEEDLIQRRRDLMDDEAVARILAKQEALGMGGDDIAIFDSSFAAIDVDIPDQPSQLPTSNYGFNIEPQRRGKGKGKGKSSRTEPTFPNATLMADVIEQDPYNGFDIMDFERPSLKPKRKGRKAEFNLDLSDEELQGQLRDSWENDRKKKKQNKLERQQMHADGLIGKKQNKFKAQHQRMIEDAPTWIELKISIEAFVGSSDIDYTFPSSLTKVERMFVHAAADAFKLRSASKGSEKAGNRCLTISKGPSSIGGDDVQFDRVCDQVQRKFFNRDGTPRFSALQRIDRGFGKHKAHKDPKTKWNDKPAHGVTYSSGEVVGSKAPEIGEDNRGRAMLEKMGWTKGTALGSLENKGSLDPVTHVFKAGRAGLQ